MGLVSVSALKSIGTPKKCWDIAVVEYTHVEKNWKETASINNFNKLYLIEDGEGVIYIDKKAYYPKKVV